MKKFSEYLNESLAAEVKSEPKTDAAREARQMGLTYMGFGRYADRSGNLAYIVHNDQLFPANKAQSTTKLYDQMKDTKNPEKAGEAAAQWKQSVSVNKKRQSEDGKIVKQKQKEYEDTAKELSKSFNAKFDKKETEALEHYTTSGFEEINRYLYKGHDEGVDHAKDKQIKSYVDALDSAFKNAKAPINYSVYTGLSGRYSPDKFRPNDDYVFRGYTSTSLDHAIAIEQASDSQVLLQIDLKKGQKSIYIDKALSKEADKETLLPRGSKVRVISGPHYVHDEAISQNAQGKSLVLFHCKLIEDK